MILRDATSRARRCAVLRHGGAGYELLEPLGDGGGRTSIARIVGAPEQRVCVKLLPEPSDPEGARALREEARLLARVRHAHVVSLLAHGEDEAAGPFLVLELVDGVDLRRLTLRLAPDRPSEAVAIHVTCAVLRALAAAQRCVPGLVHRDVTPHNVLLSVHGEVKLADFGIALAPGRPRWTRPRFVKGKLGYMSPEQILGEEVGPRSDLFAVGVLLYELLSGAGPWGPIRGVRDLRRVAQEAPRPLCRPGLERPAVEAVMRLLARRPCDRFASAEDALRALAPLGAGELGSLRLATLVRHSTSGLPDAT